MFEPVDSQVCFADLENEILAFWEEGRVFAESLARRNGCEPYVFYDGPPFATGLPHYGHLLAGTIKDVVPRYQTMLGRYVERTFGWDCHGLPIEALAQEALGLAGAPAIKERGVDVFNEQCRSMVLRYVEEWRKTVNRMGRWVDFDNGYRTMDTTFMETIWWVFKQLWDQGRIYRAHRIMPYSWKLNTPLSNFEANRNYRDVQDPAVTLRLKVKTGPAGLDSAAAAYLLVWTTTPWTLPGNLAVCVGPDIAYVVVSDRDSPDLHILARERLAVYYRGEDEYTIRLECKGSQLAGTVYEPLFPYYAERENAFVVLVDDFVTTSEGTGLVHMAPAYGEDDYRVCRAAGIELADPLDEDAAFTARDADFAGMHCKDADQAIIKHLKREGKVVRQSTIVHSYPFCERTETPLIYRAIDAWYVRVEDLRERLLASNAAVRWMPDYVGERRFANWLAEAKDWNISRNRFWGSCLPVWINEEDSDDMICVGSIAELEALSGARVTDLHKHHVDRIVIRRDGKTYRRTPEVLDCWFESGSMPYAAHHYPFEHKADVEATFPAEFIAEGLDQTRGWFYTLVVIGTSLFGKSPFRNVVVNGMVLAEDGRKMSKRLKNYPDPTEVMDSYGADALRLCLLSSPVVRAEDLRFSEGAVREVMRTVIIPLWNAYSFFVTYARVDDWRPGVGIAAPPACPGHVLDRWILSRLEATTAEIRESMDGYDLQRAALRFTGLIEDLTNWYIRRSRRRFWKSSNDADKDQAYRTLHYVLTTFAQLAAPFIPFATEAIYRNLRTEEMPESVHLCDYPEANGAHLDERLNLRMARTMTAVSLGRFLRTRARQRVRQPLPAALLVSAADAVRDDLLAMADVIAEELNVKEVIVKEDEEELVHLSAKANFKKLGPVLGPRMPLVAKAVAALDGRVVSAVRSGEVVSLELEDGGSVCITAEDVIVQRREKEGLTVANEGDVTVALDVRLTEELLAEGWAREIVSRIQNMRKEAGLDVSDRIRVGWELPAPGKKAIERFGEYIRAETLAVELAEGVEGEGEPVEVNGHPCRFRIRKAEPE